MSAEHMKMRLEEIAVWHRDLGQVEFTLVSQEPPPPPPWVNPDNWYGGEGDRLTFSVPAKKAVTQPSTGIANLGTKPDGSPNLVKYTYDPVTGSWVNPIPVDHNGVPL